RTGRGPALRGGLRAGHDGDACLAGGRRASVGPVAAALPGPREPVAGSPATLGRRIAGGWRALMLHTSVLLAFWASLFVVVFTYVGYPLWILAWGRLFPKPVRKRAYFPRVTAILAVHNAAESAVSKVEDIHFDAVLHDSHDEDHIHLLPLEFPMPMHSLAIEPRRRGDEQRISDALHKIAAEDPTFRVEHNAANQTVISGLGDLHMRYILDKMASQYHAEVTSRPPRIPYRETVTAKAEGHHRHKKQTGGAGQFGEVFLRVEPLQRGAGFEFVDEVKGGVIPNQFIPAVEKGVRQVLEAGPLAGYPMQDIRVIVYDGKHHPVDSKEVAFIAAGKRAFMDAIGKARPIILEPIVNIEITAPEANMGDIAGDISSKRGQVNGTDTLQPGTMAIKGLVPLSELDNYQARLKSVTAGQGSFSIELSHYDP
ncbi:MAG: hypothetical protein DI537_55450, partial [Stutzerimonas stutzeri]